MRITFKQLQVFQAIARCGTVSQAAEDLFMTQAACSIALANLEEQLQGAVFDRHGKHLYLNDRGQQLLVPAANILAAVQDLPAQANAGDLTYQGNLLIGASTTIGNYVLPNLIGQFVNAYPATKINLRIANTEQIIQRLLKLEIDIGFIEGHCHHPKIIVKPWQNDELIIVAAKNNPLAKKRNITLQSIKSEKWILREKGSGTREIVSQAFNHAIQTFLEFDNAEAIKQAVSGNLGISCLSTVAVKDLLQTQQLVTLKVNNFNVKRKFYLLLHKEKFKSQLIKKFITYLNVK